MIFVSNLILLAVAVGACVGWWSAMRYWKAALEREKRLLGLLAQRDRLFIPEIPELYDVAREVSHQFGFPWTDPRTGVTYPPPTLKVH